MKEYKCVQPDCDGDVHYVQDLLTWSEITNIDEASAYVETGRTVDSDSIEPGKIECGTCHTIWKVYIYLKFLKEKEGKQNEIRT